jgi:hypothetical protein
MSALHVVPSVPIVLCDLKERMSATNRDCRLAPAFLLDEGDDGSDRVNFFVSTTLIPHVNTNDAGDMMVDNRAYIDTFAAVVRDTAFSKAILANKRNSGNNTNGNNNGKSSVVVRSHVVAGLGTYTGIYAYDSAAQASHSYSYSPDEAKKNYPSDIHESRLKAMAQLANAETQMFIIDMQNSTTNIKNDNIDEYNFVTNSNAYEKPANIRLIRGKLRDGVCVDVDGNMTIDASSTTMANLVTLLRDMALSSYADTEKFGPLNKKHLVMGLWMQLAVAVYKSAHELTLYTSVSSSCRKAVIETDNFAELIKLTFESKKQ